MAFVGPSGVLPGRTLATRGGVCGNGFSRRQVSRARVSQVVMEMYDDPGQGRMYDDPLAPRSTGPKKVSKAAAEQGMSFLDAWALKNGNKIDIWVIIGALAIFVPVGGLLIGLVSGVIPGLYTD